MLLSSIEDNSEIFQFFLIVFSIFTPPPFTLVQATSVSWLNTGSLQLPPLLLLLSLCLTPLSLHSSQRSDIFLNAAQMLLFINPPCTLLVYSKENPKSLPGVKVPQDSTPVCLDAPLLPKPQPHQWPWPGTFQQGHCFFSSLPLVLHP